MPETPATGEKRGRGRPRKYPVGSTPVRPEGPKRGRGRPRKDPSGTISFEPTVFPMPIFPLRTSKIRLFLFVPFRFSNIRQRPPRQLPNQLRLVRAVEDRRKPLAPVTPRPS